MGTNTNTASHELHAALQAIRRLVRTLRNSATKVERQTGASTAQLFVLQLLAESPAESVNELAERTMTDQSSVSTVVARLQERGLVIRQPSPTDGRQTMVSITDQGRALLADAPPTVQARLVFALERLPPNDLRELTSHLTQVIALMGAAHEAPTFLFEDDAAGSH